MIIEYLTKVGGAFSKVLAGDLVSCCTDFYYKKERVTNGLRIAAIIFGAIIGVLLMTYVVQDWIKIIYTFATNGGSLNEVVIISLNNAMGIMIGSRALDGALRVFLACIYCCKYGDTHEMYKEFNYAELESIQNALAKQPGSRIKSIPQYRIECLTKKLSDKAIENIIHTVLDGTNSLLNQMKQRIIAHKPYSGNDAIELDMHWQMLRLAQTEDLCLLDSFVANLLRETFDIPRIDGRPSLALMRRLSEVEYKEPMPSTLEIHSPSITTESPPSVVVELSSLHKLTSISEGTVFDTTLRKISYEQDDRQIGWSTQP